MANLQTTIPYPGTPLSRGSTGLNVKYMQYALDGIQKYIYPNLGFLKVDGVYGSATEATVTQYQLLRGIAADGIIGKITWNAIEADYGPLPEEKYDIYPGVVLSQGSTGVAVGAMQSKLNELNPTYTAIAVQSVDGKFGQNTANATRLFQKQFSLSADEKIGEMTWNRIVSVHTNTTSGSPDAVTSKYPGTALSVGSSGDEVRFVQSYMNAVSAYNGQFYPAVQIDGVFGQKTKGLVTAFQTRFALKADGIVGQNTWAKMVQEFNAIL